MDDVQAPLAGSAQHVLRGVHADDLPVPLAEGDRVRARTAAEVEQRSGPGAEQANGRGAPWVVAVAEELGVVPVGDPVVSSHRFDASPVPGTSRPRSV